MTKFIQWRKMTWAIVLWSVVMAVWMIEVGAVLLISLVFSFGIVALAAVWFLSRPLWRQGHGARMRRLRAPTTGPVRSFENLSTGH
jgi:hypothetical protein